MPPPFILWDESAALDQLAAFVRAACPEVAPVDVYRARPAATPAKFGGSPVVVLLPLTPIPEDRGPFGEQSDSAQVQVWQVTITAAGDPGAWIATILGQQAAPYAAGGGDTPTDIAVGVRAAVDGMGVAVTTAAAVPANPAAFRVVGDVAGTSLGVSLAVPTGGAFTLEVVDDNIRRAVWNLGLWRVRVICRDVPSAQAVPASGYRYLAATLAERIRRWLQATSLPATNGLAYPYRRDQLQATPARLSWRQTSAPISLDEVDGGAWTRVVALDVEFEVPVAMTHDVPSLDAISLQSFNLQLAST